MQEFHFVNITESLQPNELDRVAIRIKSMKDYHRKKKNGTNLTKEGSTNSLKKATVGRQKYGLLLRLKLEPGRLQPTARQRSQSVFV